MSIIPWMNIEIIVFCSSRSVLAGADGETYDKELRMCVTTVSKGALTKLLSRNIPAGLWLAVCGSVLGQWMHEETGCHLSWCPCGGLREEGSHLVLWEGRVMLLAAGKGSS